MTLQASFRRSDNRAANPGRAIWQVAERQIPERQHAASMRCGAAQMGAKESTCNPEHTGGTQHCQAQGSLLPPSQPASSWHNFVEQLLRAL